MTLETPLCDLLQIKHPIVLAPMAGVSGGALAGAVSRAGGLGLIGGGYGDATWLKREFDLTDGARVGVGFITWSLARKPELLDLALSYKPAAVMLSFGKIAPFASSVRQGGACLIAQVQTLAQAREALAAGADAIVAQGAEAGGHGGARATLPLVPAIADIAGDTPVIAAGGIADGRGLAAALVLGATGVLCGTAFFASIESLASDNSKAAAIAETGDDTLRSTVFDLARGLDWPGSWTLRTCSNAFLRQWHGDTVGLMQQIETEQARFNAARGADDTDVAAVIVGEAAGMILAIEPAADIVARISRDAAARLRRRW